MLDSILNSGTIDMTISAPVAMITIVEAFILGLIISITYIKTSDKICYSQNFTLTLILIPMIIAIIILLIGSNVARAFSLAGAFSIVRFRSAPGSTKDISYIFFTMAAGLACGAGCYIYAFIFTIILCAIMFILNYINFGAKKTNEMILKITIPENLDYSNTFDDILNQYTNNYSLNKVKTIDLGSLFELEYSISMQKDTNQKNFIDKLRCRNGNLNITLIMGENKYDF